MEVLTENAIVCHVVSPWMEREAQLKGEGGWVCSVQSITFFQKMQTFHFSHCWILFRTDEPSVAALDAACVAFLVKSQNPARRFQMRRPLSCKSGTEHWLWSRFWNNPAECLKINTSLHLRNKLRGGVSKLQGSRPNTTWKRK